MDIVIGRTRSGQVITSENALALIKSGTSSTDRHDAYCVVSFLSAKERRGWLLVPDGGKDFTEMLLKIADDPTVDAMIAETRRLYSAATVFDDLRRGRALVLPSLRS
jgi:hypothetical protein